MFFRFVCLLGILAAGLASAHERPNVLFVMADDWGRHASSYAQVDGVGGINDLVSTPNFDRIAREGVLFRNAFVNSPSCTPCRSSLLSGQYFWRTGRAAILQGAVWDTAIPSFPLLMRDNGYFIGKTHKVWSPGTPADAPFGRQQYAFEKAGRRFNQFSQHATRLIAEGKNVDEAKRELLEEVRGNFVAFLSERASEKSENSGELPFLYWFGPTNVHRPWIQGSGKTLWNINPENFKGKLPPFLPDVPEIREDLADYFGEIAAFDAMLGVLLDELEKTGESKRTLIVVCGDHGAPGFPHGKCNLYDFGTRVALAIAGPGVTAGRGGRVVDDFVCLPDLAPTLLESSQTAIPEDMTAKSLWPVLRSEASGLVDRERTWVVTGRERHVAAARAGHVPYPQRSLRTSEYSFIINFQPDRFPLGDPFRLDSDDEPTPNELAENTFVTIADEDSGPTKAWLVSHRHEEPWRSLYEHAYGKRPREELYDLKRDPYQMHNVAADPAYAEILRQLREQLLAELKATEDPRLINNGEFFERPPLAGPVQ